MVTGITTLVPSRDPYVDTYRHSWTPAGGGSVILSGQQPVPSLGGVQFKAVWRPVKPRRLILAVVRFPYTGHLLNSRGLCYPNPWGGLLAPCPGCLVL